jgi:molecular chaperone GrpE (heat shock protein)
MANNDQHKANDADLRQIFKNMDAHQAQEIREAYYKAIERLMTLAEALEVADAQQTPSAGPLLTEHFNAVQALDAMKNSRLGKIL